MQLVMHATAPHKFDRSHCNKYIVRHTHTSSSHSDSAERKCPAQTNRVRERYGDGIGLKDVVNVTNEWSEEAPVVGLACCGAAKAAPRFVRAGSASQTPQFGWHKVPRQFHIGPKITHPTSG